jgi:3-hydroxyisobutyrate dehydrogenase
MLGVVIENLIEITLLTNKMGVPRHAFLSFLNNGVMGSMFTAYKSPALVNLDWTTTFTPELLRKDFAALMETMALAAGVKLASEDKSVPTGLES